MKIVALIILTAIPFIPWKDGNSPFREDNLKTFSGFLRQNIWRSVIFIAAVILFPGGTTDNLSLLMYAVLAIMWVIQVGFSLRRYLHLKTQSN